MYYLQYLDEEKLLLIKMPSLEIAQKKGENFDLAWIWNDYEVILEWKNRQWSKLEQ